MRHAKGVQKSKENKENSVTINHNYIQDGWKFTLSTIQIKAKSKGISSLKAKDLSFTWGKYAFYFVG